MLVINELQKLGPFIYHPNEGNLGDQLIATATYQIFRKHDLPFTLDHTAKLPQRYNFVFGGGGGFVPFWGNLPRYINMLTNPAIQKGVILPHSFYQADELVRALDDRFTVFCRERRSYDYCRSLNERAEFKMADDMALALDVQSILHAKPLPGTSSFYHQLTRLAGKFSETKRRESIQIWHRNRYSQGFHTWLLSETSKHLLHAGNSRIAFFMRQDAEKNMENAVRGAFDLSLQWEDACHDELLGRQLIRSFLEAIDLADIIVTDRLHIGIGAYLLHKEVYLLDNNYGKISGVLENSIRDAANIHMLQSMDDLPDALKQLLS